MTLANVTINLDTAVTTATVSMPGVEIGVPGIPGPSPVRESVVITTAALADGATENGLVTLAKGYRLYEVSADVPCRLRLYVDAAHRTADAGRTAGTDPIGDHGVIADFVLIPGVLDLTTSPLVDGYVTSGIMAPYAIENRSGASTPVQVSLTWLRTE